VTEETIFSSALDKTDPLERAAFLIEASRGNNELRERIEALLVAHETAGAFLNKPAVASVAETESRETRAFIKTPEVADCVTRTHDGFTTPVNAEEVCAFLKPSKRADSLGRLAQYEILQIIGQGGFGTVMKAFDERLHRVVAIKIMAPQLATSGTARARFLREARAAAVVMNENVVAIHAVSSDDEPIPYLVMEYVHGQTLQDKLDKVGPQSVIEVLRIGQQIARGLSAAHAQGLVHRDIKPANILLENGIERVKITDFGLARAADDASISQSGVVAGTPMYMAPEQAQGVQIDHRADLFSLGSVLYAMCTGHPPFRASTTLAVLKRVVEDSPRPIREVNSQIPPWLVDVVAKLHAKKPDDRFGTAKEVAELLATYQTELQVKGTVVPHPIARLKTTNRRRRWVPRAAGLVFLALVCYWLAPVAMLYANNQAKVEFVPQPGLISLIVLRADDNEPVTDWLDMSNPQTVLLPPGNYTVNVNCVTERKVKYWEKRWIGLFSRGNTQIPGISFTLVVNRGDRSTLSAVISTSLKPQLSPPNSDWNALFNGEDLTGWKQWPDLPGVGKKWQVVDGVLVGRETVGNLFTERGDYENFHLRAEAQINEKDASGGVWFRCPSIEILSGYKAAMSISKDASSTSAYLQRFTMTTGSTATASFSSSKLKPPVPINKWFILEVIAEGPTLTFKIDGEIVDRIKNSVYTRGHIGLESHAPQTVMEFRRIEIKELPKLASLEIAPMPRQRIP
jgi:serine/threonine protein kinase